MKQCVKKVYCPGCQRLVRCREQVGGGEDGVMCCRCGGLLWIRDGTGWRYVGKAPQ